MKFCTLDLARM